MFDELHASEWPQNSVATPPSASAPLPRPVVTEVASLIQSGATIRRCGYLLPVEAAGHTPAPVPAAKSVPHEATRAGAWNVSDDE